MLTVVGYLGGAFTAGLFVGIFAPETLDDRIVLTILGLVAGGIGILIVYLFLRLQINRKSQEISDGDILDDDIKI